MAFNNFCIYFVTNYYPKCIKFYWYKELSLLSFISQSHCSCDILTFHFNFHFIKKLAHENKVIKLCTWIHTAFMLTQNFHFVQIFNDFECFLRSFYFNTLHTSQHFSMNEKVFHWKFRKRWGKITWAKNNFSFLLFERQF